MIIVQDTKKQRYIGSAGVQPKGDVLNKRKSGRQVAKTTPVLSDFYFKTAPYVSTEPKKLIETIKNIMYEFTRINFRNYSNTFSSHYWN